MEFQVISLLLNLTFIIVLARICLSEATKPQIVQVAVRLQVHLANMSLGLATANCVGLLAAAQVLRTAQARKFFCVCDKVTIGGGRPLVSVGILCHAIGLTLSATDFYPWQFYLVCLWLYMLLATAAVTYKSTKELCWACIGLPVLALWTACVSGAALPFFPWMFLAGLVVMFCVMMIPAANIRL